jgi:hypothetical protein
VAAGSIKTVSADFYGTQDSEKCTLFTDRVFSDEKSLKPPPHKVALVGALLEKKSL